MSLKLNGMVSGCGQTSYGTDVYGGSCTNGGYGSTEDADDDLFNY